jgi:hypothetical protein
MKLKQFFSEWGMVIVQTALISLFVFGSLWLIGQWDQPAKPKTEYQKWYDKWYYKCHRIIDGEPYLVDKNTMECWYKGRIIFTETYNGKD